MRIFISYGHDANRPLIDDIRRDLEAAGHHTWIDESQIKFTDDWRRAITDGIIQSDWVLAFLSRHATRDPGVCRDELAIALRVKGGDIATVLVEPFDHVTPPVTISHLQYLDMSDWAARRTDPSAFAPWYRGKLQTILDQLANPGAQRFPGEIAELASRLRPVAQEADIDALIAGFEGRDWLLARLEAWRQGTAGRRMFWLAGAPGCGKSAFSARTAHFGQSNVVALDLCHYNLADRRSPARLIRTLAFHLATRLADYRTLLLGRIRLEDPDGAEIAKKPPHDLFDWLITQPLHACIDGGRRHDRLLLLIDALDETVDADGRCELAEVLAEAMPKLPPWIGLVVTSRPDSPIRRQFGPNPDCILSDQAENRADLEIYARAWLAARLAGPALHSMVHRVATAADGSFLYLRKLREAVEHGELALDSPQGLPSGLVSLYERWFRARFADPATYQRDILPVLQVILAAEAPVPLPVLRDLFAWDKATQARCLECLRGLFERRPAGLAPFHKSLRDWLLDADAAGPAYVVDEAPGQRRLADHLAARFAAEPQGAPFDPFLTAELPRLLATTPGHPALTRLTPAGAWDPIGRRADATIQSLQSRYAWPLAAQWLDLALTMARQLGDPARPWLRYWLLIQGDQSVTLGDNAAARRSFEQSRQVADALVQTDPANPTHQRDLSVSHNKIGDVLLAQGDAAAALAAYRDSLTIAQRLADQDPTNAQWQRDLSVSYIKIGDVLFAQGDAAAALAAYRDSLAIRQRFADRDQTNAEWQRDLSVSHEKIGNVLLAQGDAAATLAAYRDSRTIAQRLADEDPTNAQWQRDLSVSHEKIGDVLRAQGNAAAALGAYRDSLAMRQRLAEQDQTNAPWQRDLVLSVGRVGDALTRTHDDDALACCQRARALAEAWAARFPQGNGQELLNWTARLLDAAAKPRNDGA